MLNKTGLSEWSYDDHLIGFGADGASVNFGKNNGVYKKLTDEMPWLVRVHCVAHRLELAAKDAFKNSYFTNEVGSRLAICLLYYQMNLR